MASHHAAIAGGLGDNVGCVQNPLRQYTPHRSRQMRHMVLTGCTLLCLVAVAAASMPTGSQQVSLQTADDVLVTVNGSPITAGDLEFYSISRSIPDEARRTARKRLLEQLVDRQLMRTYLEKQRAIPDDDEIETQVKRIHELIRKAGDEPQEVLDTLGFNEQRLREAVALPLAWQIHVRRTVTNAQLRKYYQQHRQEYDGTEVRASQIFIKLPVDADEAAVQQAKEKLLSIRQEIAAGQQTFADAARKHSNAPSAKQGGDVGFFPYRGKMLTEFSQAAFPLKPGEVSEPFRTRYGYHLVTVTDRRPGQLSLEDVRVLIYNKLAQQAWNQLVAEQRKQAKIEWAEAVE